MRFGKYDTWPIGWHKGQSSIGLPSLVNKTPSVIAGQRARPGPIETLGNYEHHPLYATVTIVHYQWLV